MAFRQGDASAGTDRDIVVWVADGAIAGI